MLTASSSALFISLVSATVLQFSSAVPPPPRGDYPFNDVSLSWTERVDDLVSRLTLQEMTDQMAYGGRMTHAPGIPRLGIAPYPWGSECLRGDVSAGPATSFPQALGLAATFRWVSRFLPRVVLNIGVHGSAMLSHWCIRLISLAAWVHSCYSVQCVCMHARSSDGVTNF